MPAIRSTDTNYKPLPNAATGAVSHALPFPGMDPPLVQPLRTLGGVMADRVPRVPQKAPCKLDNLSLPFPELPGSPEQPKARRLR